MSMRGFAILLGATFLFSCKKSTTVTIVVTSITVSPTTLSLTSIGATDVITATVNGEEGVLANPPVSWTSSNPNIVSVTGTSVTGTVTAVAIGTSQITATAGGKTATTQITVALQQLLTIESSGDGSGGISSLPAGIACTVTIGVKAGDCTRSFNAGTSVALTATPSNLQVFTGWGGACSGTGTCSVLMDQPRTVTATFANPCATVVPYVLGSVVTGTVTAQSCPEPQRPVAVYQYQLTTPTTFSVSARSTQYAALVSPAVIGGDFWFTTAPAPNTDATSYVVAGIGTYRMFVGSTTATLGSFTLSSVLNPVLACEELDVTTGISFNGNLSTTCPLATVNGIQGQVRVRFVFLVAPAGRTLTVRMTSTAFSPALLLFDGDGNVLRSTITDPLSGTATITYPAGGIQAVFLVLTSREAGATGAYSLTIDPVAPLVAQDASAMSQAVFHTKTRAQLKAALSIRR